MDIVGTFAALAAPYCAVVTYVRPLHSFGLSDSFAARYLCASLRPKSLATTTHNVNLMRKKIHSKFVFLPKMVPKQPERKRVCGNLPLKWKKWLLARALFSCSSMMRSMFGWMLAVFCTLKPKRQVGQLVSCSSHDCKQELQHKKNESLDFIWFASNENRINDGDTYLWNKCEHGNLRAVSIFSQQMAQLSEFCDKSSAVASGYVFSMWLRTHR